jgi:MoaA/NifB/PqqE/SkfB family radical SAM enzyme
VSGVSGEAGLGLLSRGAELLFRDALKMILRDPSEAGLVLRMAKAQKEAARRRREWEIRGVQVPPVMVATMSGARGGTSGDEQAGFESPDGCEMTPERLRRVLEEARDLGISVVLLTGGEPLARSDIFGLAASFTGAVFLVHTGHTQIDDSVVAGLRRHRNVVPIVDSGEYGPPDALLGAAERLRRERLLFGAAVTVSRETFDQATSDEFVAALSGAGCKLAMFFEYSPPAGKPEDEHRLTCEQRARLFEAVESFQTRYPGVFAAFPGDREDALVQFAQGFGVVRVGPEGGFVNPVFAQTSL